MNARRPLLAALVAPLLLLGACHRSHDDAAEAAQAASDHDEPAGHDGHDEHAHDAPDEAGVRFDPDHGLLLDPEVIEVLALRTAVVERRPFESEFAITAQVLATRPRIVAAARLTRERAAVVAAARPVNATLVGLDHTAADATELVDALFALSDTPRAAPGDFVTIPLRSRAIHEVVPASAVIDAAAGSFVYLAVDGAYRRTPVEIGPRGTEAVAVTAGLSAGDILVVSSVRELWLAELRLTKGGGHSH